MLVEKAMVIDTATRDRHNRVTGAAGAGGGDSTAAAANRWWRSRAITTSHGPSATAEVAAQMPSENRQPTCSAIGAARAAGTAVLTPTMQPYTAVSRATRSGK